jgi:hypothetical protein
VVESIAREIRVCAGHAGIRSETTAAIGLEILDLLGLRDQLAIAVYYRHIVRKRESRIAA